MCVYYTECLRVSTTTRYLQTCDVNYTESLRVSTTTRYLQTCDVYYTESLRVSTTTRYLQKCDVYYTESLRVSTTTRYLQTCVSIIQRVCASPLPHATYKHVCLLYREFACLHYHTLPTNM